MRLRVPVPPAACGCPLYSLNLSAMACCFSALDRRCTGRGGFGVRPLRVQGQRVWGEAYQVVRTEGLG